MQGTIRPISINYEDTKQAIKFWNHLQLDIPYHYNILWIQELSRENKTSPSLQTGVQEQNYSLTQTTLKCK